MLLFVTTAMICLFPPEPQYACFRQNLSMLVFARTSVCLFSPEPQYACVRQNLNMLVSARTSVCLFPSEPQYACFRQNLNMLVSVRTSICLFPPKPQYACFRQNLVCLFPPEPAQPESGPASFFLNLVKQLDVRPLLQNIIMNVNYNNGDASDKDHANTWY